MASDHPDNMWRGGIAKEERATREQESQDEPESGVRVKQMKALAFTKPNDINRGYNDPNETRVASVARRAVLLLLLHTYVPPHGCTS